MAKQRIVNTKFWRDTFVLSLKSDERFLFLWVITNPQTDLCGAYEAPISIIEIETGLKQKRIVEIFEKFQQAGKILYRDGWVVVRNFAKHQSTGPNIAKGIERSLSICPDWIKETLSKGMQGVSKGIAPKPELKPKPEPERANGFQKPPYQPLAPEKETDVWIAGIAKVVGATAKTLTRAEKWRDVASKADLDGILLPEFLKAVEQEYARPPDEHKYITPEKCLERAQLQRKAKAHAPKTQRDHLREEGLIA